MLLTHLETIMRTEQNQTPFALVLKLLSKVNNHLLLIICNLSLHELNLSMSIFMWFE